mgnify:CR=1 FL=1
MKNLRDLKDLKNKKVLLRLDLNVPLKDEIIEDETRINKILPVLKFLLKANSKIIIVSHIGRPKGKINPKLSLKPICKNLENKLNEKIKLISDDLRQINEIDLFKNRSENILVLENIRFYLEEERNDLEFSKNLASFADIYINDAFSCSHRKQASIHNITKFVKHSYAGPLLKKEIEAINQVIQNKKKPVTCIIGGSKISTKINVITSLIKKIDNLIIVGAMANNFFVYQNFKVGKSLIEENTKEIIKKIYDKADESNCKILIPEDCMVGTSFKGNGENKDLSTIQDNEIILDIGSKTIKCINEKIDQSNTVLWNGPAGYFENENFITGTMSIAETISKNTSQKSLISILGGGDTLAAVNKTKNKLSFTHLSTAGGAFLEYLEGKDLPGLRVLK